ncbi:MAG: UDP-glucose 4-epimerase GalE, partial [Roseibium sp.]
ISQITKKEIPVIRADVRDQSKVAETLAKFSVNEVIHLAGKKAVGESVADPFQYYDANVGGGLSLLRAMNDTGVERLIFSSSATVYDGTSQDLLDERAPLGPNNPYGRTKLFLEEIISDAVAAGKIASAISLRYFNPVGCHSSGKIGENPVGAPNNLFPYIAQTAAGLRDKVSVFGDDYNTRDGTGIRDYIHVVDLARGHVAALDYLADSSQRDAHLRVNLGTGNGHSVKEVLAAFSDACGLEVPHEIVGRRPGDAASCIANPELAEKLLNWRAGHTLEQMCQDHWAFQCKLQTVQA